MIQIENYLDLLGGCTGPDQRCKICIVLHDRPLGMLVVVVEFVVGFGLPVGFVSVNLLAVKDLPVVAKIVNVVVILVLSV